MRRLTALVLLSSFVPGEPKSCASCPDHIQIKASVRANDVFSTKAFASQLETEKLSCSLRLRAKSVSTKVISTVETATTVIRAADEDLVLEGYTSVTGSIEYNAGKMSTDGFMPASTSFLEEEESVRLHKSEASWDLVSVDGFDGGNAGAWNVLGNPDMKLSTHCGDGNFFLGGHCLTAGHEAERQFLLPMPHEQLHISATFHFIDSWFGEIAFAKVDGEFVWLDSHGSPHNHTGIAMDGSGASGVPSSLLHRSKSTCGSPDHPDTRLGSTFDVYVPHNSSSVTISFGSSLNRDPCQASWGVDNVHVFVR